MRFSDDPYMMKLKNPLSCEIYSFEKLWLANLWNSKPIKMDKKIKLVFTNCSNLCQRWDRKSITWNMCWGPPSSGGIWKQLRRRKQIERVGLLQSKGKWSNWLPFEKISLSSSFWHPRAPLEPKSPNCPPQEPPQKWFSFRKHDERGWKSTLSTSSLKEQSKRIVLRSFCHLNWPYSTYFAILANFSPGAVC